MIRMVGGSRTGEGIVAPPAAVGGPKWRAGGEEDLLIARNVILCLAGVICLTIFLRGYNKQHNGIQTKSSKLLRVLGYCVLLRSGVLRRLWLLSLHVPSSSLEHGIGRKDVRRTFTLVTFNLIAFGLSRTLI